MTHYIYLLINLLSMSVPFAYSFTAHSGFSRHFPRAFLAIIAVAVPMIVWDVWFTAAGVWSFNPDYHLGLELFGLPLEEMLFFVCIPFACLFIYDSIKRFPRLALPERPVRMVLGVLAAVLLVTALLNTHRLYTSLCFAVAGLLLVPLAAGHLRHRVGHMATAYLFHLIPFFLVNGLLTSLPVVLYNNAENLGFRLGTIPLEDSMYSMILLFGAIMILEGKGTGSTGRNGGQDAS